MTTQPVPISPPKKIQEVSLILLADHISPEEKRQKCAQKIPVCVYDTEHGGGYRRLNRGQRNEEQKLASLMSTHYDLHQGANNQVCL